MLFPLDTECIELDVLCALNLYPVSRGLALFLQKKNRKNNENSQQLFQTEALKIITVGENFSRSSKTLSFMRIN